MTYNSWANWETWNMHQWLTGDEDTTHAAHIAAQQEGAQGLREYVQSDLLAPAMDASPMAADFLNYTLDQVDWEEVATELMQRVGGLP